MHLCTLYEYKYSYVCTCYRMHSNTHIMYLYTHMYIYIYMRVCVCVCMYVCAYKYIHIYIYIHTHIYTSVSYIILACTSIPKPFPGARLRRSAVGLRSHVQRQPLARRRSVCRVADRQSWGRSTARGRVGMTLRSGFL